MADDANITPEIREHPTVAAARLRHKAERAIDALLNILDELGGDADVEPSLGFLEPAGNMHTTSFGDQSRIAEGAADDREAEPDEHNLGWESHGAQAFLGAGSDDLEPTLGRTEAMDQRPQRAGSGHEDEPTNGSSDHRDQTRWAHNADRDDSEREEVSEDEGADTGDSEPMLGFHETPTGSAQFAGMVAGYDELEPSLGSTHGIDQRRWANHFAADATHASFDYEEEHDGCEEEVDAEHNGCEPEDGW